MKLGRVSETIMQRSILKYLPVGDSGRIIAPSPYETCAGVDLEASEDVVFSDVSLYGEEEQLGVFAIDQALNEVLIKGAIPVGVNIGIMMPRETEEVFLRAMAEQMSRSCGRWKASVLGIQAEVSPVLSQTVIRVTAVGAVKKDRLMQKPDKSVSRDIVLTKWIGAEGTLRILRKEQKALSERFVPAFLQGVESWQEMLPAGEEIEIARCSGVTTMRQVTDGGIFAALWYLAAETGTGLEVRMDAIPIRQETVEICEYFRINPYQLTSAGCLLMLVEDGGALTEKMSANGISASVLGRTAAGNDKVILRGEERRFLDRPAQDQLLKLYNE